MSNHLKIWWERRKAKHYLKSHWHLIADIVLALIILGLIISLVVINYSSKQKVNTNSVDHVAKDFATTTSEVLTIKTSVNSDNIYSGKPVNLHLSLENNSDSAITAISLVPTFLSNSFTISKIESNNASSSLKIKSNKLLLEKLAVGETSEADVIVTINAKEDSPRAIDWLLKATFKAGDQNYKNDYSLNTLKLITDLKVQAAAYYNSQFGDQLGSGPVPPIVGLPTNYWVFFEADDKGNDLNNLVVSAKLASGITLLANNKTLSAGDFNYNDSQKRLTWIVKKVSVASGRYQVGFEVQLLPNETQLGTNPLLVTNISYSAIDAYTGESLSGKLPDINTELPLDTINQGQGKVIK